MNIDIAKPRSDSKCFALAQAQRDTLAAWLFDDNLSYQKVREKLKAEFGLSVSCATLARYYQHIAAVRSDSELSALTAAAPDAEVIQMQVNAMKLLTKKMISGSIEKSEDVHELATLAKVLLVQQSIDVKRRWLQLAETRYADEIEKAHMAKKEKEEARAYTASKFKEMFDRFTDLGPESTATPVTP